MIIVVCSVTSIILLFASMVLSSMAANDARKGKTASAQKWSTWSAVVSGISILIVVVIFIVHVNRKTIGTRAQGWFGRAQQGMGAYAGSEL